MKGAVAELSVSGAIPEILPFYVLLIVSVVIIRDCSEKTYNPLKSMEKHSNF